METYNYKDNVKNAIIEYMKNNPDFNLEEEESYNNLMNSDDITGTLSGSYTIDREKAKQNISGNEYLIYDLVNNDYATYEEIGKYLSEANYEKIDVVIRCYVFNKVIDRAIEEYNRIWRNKK